MVFLLLVLILSPLSALRVQCAPSSQSYSFSDARVSISAGKPAEYRFDFGRWRCDETGYEVCADPFVLFREYPAIFGVKREGVAVYFSAGSLSPSSLLSYPERGRGMGVRIEDERIFFDIFTGEGMVCSARYRVCETFGAFTLRLEADRRGWCRHLGFTTGPFKFSQGVRAGRPPLVTGRTQTVKRWYGWSADFRFLRFGIRASNSSVFWYAGISFWDYRVKVGTDSGGWRIQVRVRRLTLERTDGVWRAALSLPLDSAVIKLSARRGEAPSWTVTMNL